MQSLDLHSFIQYFFSSWLIWVILFTDATDIWQPVDAGYGWLVKKLISKAQDNWLELDENIDIWMGNSEKPFTTSDRRILITQWVGEAFEELKNNWNLSMITWEEGALKKRAACWQLMVQMTNLYNPKDSSIIE